MSKQFLKLISLRVILLVLCKCNIADSRCTITPGNRNLAKHTTAVIVVLNCAFNGFYVDTVSWKRNKQPVENNTLVDSSKHKKWSAAVLYGNLTSIQDLGEFTCEAKRGQNVFSCSVLPSKPKLTRLPSVITATAGNTPELVCAASGWPVPSLSWWRKSLKIRDGDYHYSYMIRKVDDNQLSMKILAIEGYHHGTYFCRADNILGVSEEYVNIMVKREMIKNDNPDRQGTVAIEGRNTTLECICVQTECKEETASIYWKYNNRSNVNPSQKLEFSKKVLPSGVKMAMSILNVSPTDQGKYFCGINTSKGFAESPRKLRVISKVNAPRISATSNASVTHGSPIWLRCEAVYPDILKSPNTSWIFNNTRLAKESPRYQSKDVGPIPIMGLNSTTKHLSLRLHIFNVSAQDVGWYTCGAEFKIDVVTASIR